MRKVCFLTWTSCVGVIKDKESFFNKIKLQNIRQKKQNHGLSSSLLALTFIRS